MTASGGRFTARGGDAVEAQITALVKQVGAVVADLLPPEAYRALILIGGYGRGEGGVELRNGVERPHNNLDFLLITESSDGAEAARIQRELNAALASLEAEHDLGLDLSIMPVAKLQRSPCLVMWYDMRFGHKTVVGDPEFVRSFTRYTVERIVPSDVLWLLVNRGSQILVNDLLLARGELRPDERRYIVKLTMKAIIGYGDALLFFQGLYHWSYREKARRMEAQADVSAPFKALYAQAIDFRFQPDYAPFLDRDLAQWLDGLRGPLEEVHRRCESLRLGAAGWSWEAYPGMNHRHAMRAEILSPRATAKKLRNLLRSDAAPATVHGLDRLAYRLAGRRGLLPVCYPVVAYRLTHDTLRTFAAHALGARDSSPEEIRRVFLTSWGELVDPNFFKVAKRFRLFDNPKEHNA